MAPPTPRLLSPVQPQSKPVYTQGFGTAYLGAPIVTVSPPSPSNIQGPNGLFKLGQEWVDTVNNTVYVLTSYSSIGGVVTANWASTAIAGALDTLSGDTGTATPVAGDIQLLGTPGQITTTASGSQIVFSIDTPMTIPGNLTVTGNETVGGTLTVTGLTTLGALTQAGVSHINITGGAATVIGTGGTGTVSIGNTTGNTAVVGGLTVSTTLGVTGLSTLAALTQAGTASINASGAAATTIGTGGTGAVNIGNATGGTIITGPASVSTTLGVTGLSTLGALTQVGTANINASGAAVTTIGTGGTGAVNIGNATGNTAVTGSLTASTTLTATLGDITATNGNLNLAAAGNKLLIHASTAASDSVGTSAALGTGTVTVSTTAVTASSIILVSPATAGGTQGFLSVANIVPGTSFDILSSDAADTSTVNYLIIN